MIYNVDNINPNEALNTRPPPHDSSTYLINLFIWEIQLRHFNEGDKGKAIESSMIQNFTSELKRVLNSQESEFWIIDNLTNYQMIC
jgi:hypothetical protein